MVGSEAVSLMVSKKSVEEITAKKLQENQEWIGNYSLNSSSQRDLWSFCIDIYSVQSAL